MPLVTLTIDDINKGFKSDIAKFNETNKATLPSLDLISTFSDVNSIIKCINDILAEMDSILVVINSGEPTFPKSIKDELFEYSHDINTVIKKDKEKSNMLWGLRHKLCFQLLTITYVLLSNQSLFEIYYSDKQPKRVFKTEIAIDNLSKFKLGIWGSINVTSDIDIGFQYADIIRIPGAISHVVSIFEDVFLQLTGKNTLSFDIEPYADMMYMDYTNENSVSISKFYCNSTDFTVDDLITYLMPAIGASVIRNYIQSQIDLNMVKDIRRHKGDVVDETTLSKLNADIANFKFAFSEMKILSESFSDFKTILNNTSWNAEAIIIAKEYMENPYNKSRETYYTKVGEAEKILADNFAVLLSETSTIPDKQIRLNLMKAIAIALNYRAESYVSPSTVSHIVRVLQANEKLDSKSQCEEPKYPKSKAQCVLGKVGYIMSIIEQAGYLMRFRLTYCENNNPEKCKKKVDKYLPRLYNGLTNLLTGGEFEKLYLPGQASSSNVQAPQSVSNPISAFTNLTGLASTNNPPNTDIIKAPLLAPLNASTELAKGTIDVASGIASDSVKGSLDVASGIAKGVTNVVTLGQVKLGGIHKTKNKNRKTKKRITRKK
jgi:hypothetical protein